MKHFFALPALLRSAALLASASQNTFSVNDDLLAFPQYEVRFVDEWTSEEDAQSRLLSSQKLYSQQRTDSNGILQDSPSSQVGQYGQQGQEQHVLGENEVRDGEQAEYEHMMLHGQPWLCRVPKVKKPIDGASVNDTLSKAEEEKELARATDRGWELLSGMQGNCVFFISGWWSYKFCYNQGVKQFHQLPPSRGVPVYPPVEDPGVEGYTLGSYETRLDGEEIPKDDKWDGESALEMSDGSKRKFSDQGELVQRGESRYLSQKLGGGTICDLTGKERRVEVQFHCNPQTTDRIALIKEISTCTYLLIIQTPRLCNDVAFLSPQKDQPNTISCSPVLREDEVAQYERDVEADKRAEADAKKWAATLEAGAALGAEGYEPIELPVGDIYVGEHRLVPEGQKIEKSAIVGGGKKTYIDTVANSEGKVLSKEDMERLGLGDPRAVEKLRKELEKIAEGQNWRLDVIDTPMGREYQGIIGDDEDDKEAKESEKKKTSNKNKKAKDGSKDRKGKDQPPPKTGNGGADEGEKQEGSEEEYFHEEL